MPVRELYLRAPPRGCGGLVGKHPVFFNGLWSVLLAFADLDNAAVYVGYDVRKGEVCVMEILRKAVVPRECQARSCTLREATA